MRCLAGVEWGACRQSLKRVYGALIRAAIDYGCMVYSSASKSQLLNVEAIQSQALRICCGAIRSSPITAVQVEMGEMLLEFRRLKLKMRYWINIKGHSDSHPIKKVLKNCWEYEYTNLSSFGWTANEEAQSMGLSDITIAPSVATSAIPPWLFPMPVVDTQLYEGKHNKERSILTHIEVQQYIEQTYYSTVKIYTDGSKDPESGFAAAVYIPQFKVNISKSISDQISVFTTEIIAIFLALQWIEVQPIRSVICTDSLSVLNSLLRGNATARQDMIFEVMQSLFRISQSGLVNFMWVPSHMGVDGNEVADHLAKLALKQAQIDIKVSMSKTEVKGLIANEIRKKWQKEWDSGKKGTHLYHIQEKVARERRKYGNRKDDVLMSRMRIGHCLLNQCLHRMRKHETGKCDKCGHAESIEHVLIVCEMHMKEKDFY